MRLDCRCHQIDQFYDQVTTRIANNTSLTIREKINQFPDDVKSLNPMIMSVLVCLGQISLWDERLASGMNRTVN
jgi:hypothetical protein